MSPIINGGGGGGGSLSSAVLRLSSTAHTLHSGDTIPFDLAFYDPGGYFNAVGSSLVVPNGKAGIFVVGGWASVDAPALATFIDMQISNSGADANIDGPGVLNREASCSGMLHLAVGDTLTMAVLFDGGGTTNIYSPSQMWLAKVA